MLSLTSEICLFVKFPIWIIVDFFKSDAIALWLGDSEKTAENPDTQGKLTRGAGRVMLTPTAEPTAYSVLLCGRKGENKMAKRMTEQVYSRFKAKMPTVLWLKLSEPLKEALKDTVGHVVMWQDGTWGWIWRSTDRSPNMLFLIEHNDPTLVSVLMSPTVDIGDYQMTTKRPQDDFSDIHQV